MKFRTFITTLVLFLTMFYTGLLLISIFMLSNQLDTAKQQGISEHYLIASSFSRDLTAVLSRNVSLDDSIEPLFDFYTEYYKQQDVFLEILKDGNVLYLTFAINASVPCLV